MAENDVAGITTQGQNDAAGRLASSPTHTDVGAVLKGLPLGDLVGAPLKAACDAQIMLAQSIATFITEVGFVPVERDNRDPFKARQVKFNVTRPSRQANGAIATEQVGMSVPLLSIVPIPNLQVENVSVDFQISIHSQISETVSMDTHQTGEWTQGGGCLDRTRTKMNGEVSTHHDQTRKGDISARYSFHVEAKQQPPPEGLLKVLDVLNSACAPIEIKVIDRGRPPEVLPSPPR